MPWSMIQRMNWGMTYPDVLRVPGKPPAGIAVQARPGTYTARLAVDGQSQEQNGPAPLPFQAQDDGRSLVGL